MSMLQVSFAKSYKDIEQRKKGERVYIHSKARDVITQPAILSDLDKYTQGLENDTTEFTIEEFRHWICTQDRTHKWEAFGTVKYEDLKTVYCGKVISTREIIRICRGLGLSVRRVSSKVDPARKRGLVMAAVLRVLDHPTIQR